MRASASPLYNNNEVSAVVSVWHDVTEREHLLEQLEIEQSRLETIIQNAPEAFLVMDEEGQLVFGNQEAKKLFGHELPFGESIDHLSTLQICYEDGTPCEPRNLPLTCSALDGEHFHNIELLVILPDGQTRNLLLSSAPIVDHKGNLNGAAGIFQDITQRKRAEQILRQQASRSQLLATLSKAFAEAGLHYTELLDSIVQEIGFVFGDVCSLLLIVEDEHRLSHEALYLKDASLLQPLKQLLAEVSFHTGDSVNGQVFSTGKPSVFTDVMIKQVKRTLPPRHAQLLEMISAEWLNGIVVPLRAHGRWIGAMHILRLQFGNHFTPEDQAFLQDLVDRAALAIEDSKLYEREAQRARELLALNRATTSLLATIDLETLLTKILDAAKQAIPAAEQGVLYLHSAEGGLEIRSAIGCGDLNAIDRILVQEAEQTTNEKKSRIIENLSLATTDSAEKPSPSFSAILAPLRVEREKDVPQVLGILALIGPRPNLFGVNDLRLVDSFAATATAALQNATLYAEVQRLATTDAVTEQLNRRRFFELGDLEMHRFHRFHNPLSAIMLDLDNFKDVNDTYGHAVGDQVLRSVAIRCRANIRIVDILGRYGGDEFVILLPGADLNETQEIAERIRQSVIQSRIPTNQGPVPISISLGIAQASYDMDNLSVLLGRADAALYAAKQRGRNRVMQTGQES